MGIKREDFSGPRSQRNDCAMGCVVVKVEELSSCPALRSGEVEAPHCLSADLPPWKVPPELFIMEKVLCTFPNLH